MNITQLFAKILVLIDGSGSSFNVAHIAINIATEFNCKITLLNIVVLSS